jgi:mRNA interferase RelE/StbE
LKVFLSRKAEKALEDAPPGIRRRLDEGISELSRTPFPAGCKKLRGARNTYRLRIGDYRVLYVIVKKDEILVFKIARRETVYD